MSRLPVVPLVLIVIFNLLMHLLVVPYAQRCHNSHLPEGPFIAVVLVVISLIGAIVALSKARNIKGDSIHAGLIIIAGISLFFWAYQLYNLGCQGCAEGG